MARSDLRTADDREWTGYGRALRRWNADQLRGRDRVGVVDVHWSPLPNQDLLRTSDGAEVHS